MDFKSKLCQMMAKKNKTKVDWGCRLPYNNVFAFSPTTPYLLSVVRVQTNEHAGLHLCSLCVYCKFGTF